MTQQPPKEKSLVADKRELATKIARHIFELGNEPSGLGGIVQRIQYMGGTYPDNEIQLGGLCENALVEVIYETLSSPEPSDGK